MAKGLGMSENDVLNAKLAECYVTIDGKRYNFIHAKKVEAKVSLDKKDLTILGKTGKAKRATGWEGTGSATFYFNTPIFRRLLLEFKNTGKEIFFDMQLSNEDPVSSVGRQTVMLYNCSLDEGILAKFDTDGDFLEEDANFTFSDYDIPQEFNELSGM